MASGADTVLQRLLAGGVDVCFANPGTSEMHFVAALDNTPPMRAVLCLFEGVATGAADGYARIAGTPAATLLHLGPGLANGLANLHNARRAHTPVVNVVGDHATHHVEFDAPLQSDIEALAGWPDGLVFRPQTADALTAAVDAAVTGAVGPPGRVATVILPADYSWGPAEQGAPLADPVGDDPGPGGIGVQAAAELLREHGADTVVLLGGSATGSAGLHAAARIAEATGARPLVETFPARVARGRGVPAIERLAYLGEQAEQQLAGATRLLLVGTRAPVAFFAYPGRASGLVPSGAQVHVLDPAELDALADRLGAGHAPLWAVIESAEGLKNAWDIAASPGLEGVLFGGADYSVDIGSDMEWDALAYARGRLVAACARAGVQLLDVPFLDVRDPDGLIAATRRVRAMGFTGRACIHPDQVKGVHEALTPTPAQVDHANEVIEIFKAAEGGPALLNGKLIDLPILRAAERVLDTAKKS